MSGVARVLALVLALALAGCGADAPPGAAGGLPPAAEPAVSPPLEVPPAGRTIVVGRGPEGVVADPRTGLVAVALRDPARLALVDARAGRVVATVRLPGSARHLALAAPGGPVLVPAESANALVRVALPSGRVLDRVPVGRQPHDALGLGGGRVLVSDELGGTVSVVRGGRVVRRLGGFPQPAGLAATRGRVGVIDVRANVLALLDAGTLRPVARLPAGAGPTHLAADGAGHLVAVDTRGGAVLVFAVRPRPRLVARVAAPGRPYGVAVDERRRLLWVALTARNRLVAYRLGPGTPRQVASLPTVRQPDTVAVDPATGRVLVTGSAADALEIIDPDVAGR